MRKRWTLVALATTTLLAAGCGAALTQAAARDEAVAVATGGFALMGVSPDRPGRALAGKLGLTAAQQARMAAIAARHRGDVRPDLAAHRAEARALLTAPTVDPVAVAAFLRARAADFEAQQPARLALAGELRGVLTPAQRETLAGLIESHAAGGALARDLAGKLRGRATAALGLTAAQGEALDALVAAGRAMREGPRAEALRTAAAGFVRTGDAQALARATTGLAADLPIDEAAALAASLDAQQRAAIVARAERVMAGHRR